MPLESALVDDELASRDAVAASVEAAFHVLAAKRKKDAEFLEEQKRECAKVRVDAVIAAAIVKEAAATEAANIAIEAAEILRKAHAERAALDAEKAAMEKTYAFQTKKTLLNVGRVRFETSLPTLTSVRDTYIGSMFSGCFPLSADPDGAYFIDRPTGTTSATS
jgi:uncharacterized protein YdaU (DUF1376 family)